MYQDQRHNSPWENIVYFLAIIGLLTIFFAGILIGIRIGMAL